MARSNARGKLWWILGLLLVLGVAGASWIGSQLRGGEARDVARRLPADVSLIVIGRGALELGRELAPLTTSNADPTLRALVQQLSERVGFDLTSPSAWLATGYDPTRPWALAARPHGPDPDEDWEVFVLVPSRDDAALERTVLSFYEKTAVPLVHEPHAGFTAHRTPSGVAFGVHDGWLALARSDDAERRPSLDTLAALLGGPEPALGDDAGFRDALASADEGWHLFGYAAPAAVELARLGASGAASWSPAFAARGATLSARLTDRELSTRVSLLHAPGSGFDSVRAGQLVAPLDPRVPGTPFGVLRLQLDLPRAWDVARSEGHATGHDFDAVTRRLREETGIDFVEDVLTPLDGRLTVLLLPQPGEVPTPIEIVVYAGVRDVPRLDAVLARSAARIDKVPLTIDKAPGGTWYTTPDRVGVGLEHEHLIIALGDPPRVRAALARGDQSFLGALPERARAGLASDHTAFAFLDSEQSARLLDAAELDFNPAPQSAAVRTLRGISSAFRVAGDAWTLDTIAYAREPGFTKTWTEQLGRIFGAAPP